MVNLSYLYLYWFMNPKCEKSQSSENYNAAPLGICAWYDRITESKPFEIIILNT